MTSHRTRTLTLAVTGLCTLSHCALGQLAGDTGAHDPSSLIMDGSTYYYFATGQGIAARYSTDKVTWYTGPPVFSNPPAWTTQAVSGFTGFFWAPDVAYFNGSYHLYYAASSWGTIDSAIGVATSPSLTNPVWTDQGKVVQSDAVGHTQPQTDTTAYNAIDPSILVDTDGKVWMSWGSYSSGIVVTQLDPKTGKRLNGSSLGATLVANNAPGGGWGSSIEGSALVRHGSYYYLFVNYGTCCSGVDSTYNIRVGRSTSPTGPFLDKNGADMRNGGGSMFLDDDGKMIGPGHLAYFAQGGQDYFSYHYYNGDTNGTPTYGLRNLYWTGDNWPSYAAVNPDWTGATNTNWAAGANWSGGAIPDGVGHVANFGSNAAGRYVVSLGAARTVSTINFTGTGSYTIGTTDHVLTLDAQPGDSATINVSAGNHAIAASVTAGDNLGVNVTPSDSTLTLSGPVAGLTLIKYGHGTLSLGAANAYTGSVFVKWGTLDINGSVSTAQYTSVGQIPGENGTMVVRGTGNFTANADLNIGDTGDAVTPATGGLRLRDNATVTVNSPGGFFVGSGFSANTRATGTVDQTGGTLTTNNAVDGTFVIGGRGSAMATGTYNLTGGTVNANTNVQVGGRGTGTMNQSGGAFNANGYVFIGRYAGAAGAWDIGGGTLNQTNASRGVVVGAEGSGTLTLSGSGSVNVAGPLRMGTAGTGAGTVNLNGGTLTTIQIVEGAGAATVNFNGGTLRAAATAGTSSFMQGLTNAYVQSGGAVIDVQAFTVTIPQSLLHDPALSATDGGVTKVGPGTLTLSGSNTYTGPTTVTTGQLTLRPAAFAPVLTGPGGAHILSGKLVFDYAGTGSPQANVLPLLANSYSQAWAGGAMRAPADDARHGLGWLDDTATSQLVIAYTYYGDTNLDGVVNADDYALLDRGFAKRLAGWVNGDFNYDGVVNPADYLLADAAYGQVHDFSPGFLSRREAQFGPSYVPQLLAAVPEPDRLGPACLGAIPAFRRRRR